MPCPTGLQFDWFGFEHTGKRVVPIFVSKCSTLPYDPTQIFNNLDEHLHHELGPLRLADDEYSRASGRYQRVHEPALYVLVLDVQSLWMHWWHFW